MLKVRRSCNRLIFNMGIPIPGTGGLYIESGPRVWSQSPHISSWDPQCGYRKKNRDVLGFILRCKPISLSLWYSHPKRDIISHIATPLQRPTSPLLQ